MPPLVLVADDVKDPWHWFWRLKDDRGTLLAHHEVALDPADWQAQAFTDLYRYSGIIPTRAAGPTRRPSCSGRSGRGPGSTCWGRSGRRSSSRAPRSPFGSSCRPTRNWPRVSSICRWSWPTWTASPWRFKT